MNPRCAVGLKEEQMRWTIALTLLAVFGSSLGSTAQRYDVSVREVLAVLEKGSLEEREEMMARVVKVRATAKSPVLAAAIAGELIRMNAVTAERQDRMRRGIPDPTAPGIGEYKASLIQACTQTDDPVVIDALVGVINTGNMATRALARFGPLAFERVAAVAEHGADGSKVSSALRTLMQMVELDNLPPVHKSKASDIARSRLTGPQRFIVFSGAINLATALGTPDLLEEVEEIALGLRLPEIEGITDMGQREHLQRRAREALAKLGR
jgi:hypothetical protein